MSFWLFVGGGVIGAILIIILVVCLVKMKKRNDLIVAKVEKLTEDQKTGKKQLTKAETNDDFYASQRKAAIEAEMASGPAASPF